MKYPTVDMRERALRRSACTVSNVRVKQIRPEYDNLRDWMDDPNNVYVGRGKIVIIEGERYPPYSSIFCNPYKISSYASNEDCLRDFFYHIRNELAGRNISINALLSLDGKNLGCWCDNPLYCHASILIYIIEEMKNH